MKCMVAAACVLGFAASAMATTYSFSPNDGAGDVDDLMDLDHSYLYAWRVQVDIDGPIVGATITFNDMYNWANEPYNVIYVHVLDNAPAGGSLTRTGSNVRQYVDSQASFYDNFTPLGGYAGKLERIPYDNPYTLPLPLDYTLDLSSVLSQLNTFAADGLFWIGIDPDCHFYNTGVKLELQTAPVPEPATLSLLGLGLLGLVGLRKRGRK